MRTVDEVRKRIAHYRAARCIYDSQVGYIVWHVGTGDNIEMLFIEVVEPRKGYGTELYRRMCKQLIADGTVPYHSVYGHRLASNKVAAGFYTSLGFTQVNLGQSIYATDGCVVMWVPWGALLDRLGIKP